MANGVTVTTRLKDVVRPRGLPVTVMGKVPAAVAAVVVMVSVVAQVGLQDPSDKAAVAPLGRPDTEKDTAWVWPAVNVAVMVVAPEAPAITVTPPELASE